MYKTLIFTILIVFFVFSKTWATYTLDSYSFLDATLYTVDTATQAATGNRTLFVLSYQYQWTLLDGGITNTLPTSSVAVAAAVNGTPSVFPNPFRFSDNPQFGYWLSKDMDIQIRIYDMRAHEVYRKDFISGTSGGAKDYNRVYLSREEFHRVGLSSGVYFFLIINQGKVLGKGKFVVKP